MNLVQIKDEIIVKSGLPKNGFLKDGTQVSGYHLLEETILQEEGWLPLEENKPTLLDGEVHEFSHYEILVDKVIVHYVAIVPPPPEPTEDEVLWQTITDLQLDLMLTNQDLTNAQIEIETLKGGTV